ncbi:MAG: DUF3048 domain-containing protein [Chloroflexota bacterium]|nr:DUF3048 domain-containing protein [Chloroflexota bacterium]
MTDRRRGVLSTMGIALLLLSLVSSACGVGTITPSSPSPTSPAPSVAAFSLPSAAPSTTPSPSPTPSPRPVVWPLTGLPAPNAAAIQLRPLNVRIPNDPAARPQVGLSKADLVFEMIVEGGVTRFAAIYQSQQPKAVGPVRSYRWSDLHITQLLRGILVASGATREEKDGATLSMSEGNMITVDADRVAAPYYRVSGRPTPNNMFADLAVARQVAVPLGGSAPVDVPPLAFLPSLDHEPTAGGFGTSVEATTVTIPFERDPATFTYDPSAQGYDRTQAGTRTVDLDGNVPILARNVIVMHTNIWETSVIEDIYGSKGLDYRMTGGGAAEIFRDGRRVDGTWKRDGVLDQFTFYDKSGTQILLDPGQSWIHFVYPDWVIASH